MDSLDVIILIFKFLRLNVSRLGDAGLSNSYGLLGYDIIAHRGYPVYQTLIQELILISMGLHNTLPFLINIRLNCVIRLVPQQAVLFMV